MADASPRFRSVLDSFAAYKPGRTPVSAAGRTHKLSSNESPYQPLPSVVDVIAEAARSVNRYPDNGAQILTQAIADRFGVPLAVIISDSFGRAWRRGTCGVAIGAAGLPSLMDLRGSPDLFGRELQVSITGHADEIAAAASLVMGQGAEGQPVVIVRGLAWRGPDNGASELVRPAAEDMFR